ncbi:MAG: xanthine dehydrogenase accessory factor [Bacteriovoracaceae bacterium]|jgi:xanthine dehydrogenase accessory factor
MLEFSRELDKFILSHGEVVLAIQTSHRGSAPQVDGAKAIIASGGLLWGTVGGGKVEQAIKKEGLDLLESKETTKSIKWNLQKDIGMTCGGEVSFFLEKFGKPNLEIAVFGAGHVAQAFVPLLLNLNCSVSSIDSRLEWLNKLPENEKLKKLHLEEMSSYIDELKPGTFIISMTQGHKFDLPILEKALKCGDKFPYVGVIGSKQKAQVIRQDLLSLGSCPNDLERLICPIGLDLGRNIPEEIAFSIIAQILQVRDRLS